MSRFGTTIKDALIDSILSVALRNPPNVEKVYAMNLYPFSSFLIAYFFFFRFTTLASGALRAQQETFVLERENCRWGE